MKTSTFFAIVLILGFLLFGYMHEQVHMAIYRSYNISSFMIIEFPDLVTIGERKCPNHYCDLAHNNNDAVGYHLMVFYAIFGSGLYLLISLVEDIYGRITTNKLYY